MRAWVVRTRPVNTGRHAPELLHVIRCLTRPVFGILLTSRTNVTGLATNLPRLRWPRAPAVLDRRPVTRSEDCIWNRLAPRRQRV